MISELSPDVLRYDARHFVKLVTSALKRKNDKDLFFRWVMEGYSTKISFDEYKDALKPIPNESEKEILERTKNIMDGVTWQHHSLSL